MQTELRYIGSGGVWQNLLQLGQTHDHFLFRNCLVQAVIFQDVHLAHGAGAFLQQPLVNAALVKLMPAGKVSHNVANFEQVDADRAGLVHVRNVDVLQLEGGRGDDG